LNKRSRKKTVGKKSREVGKETLTKKEKGTRVWGWVNDGKRFKEVGENVASKNHPNTCGSTRKGRGMRKLKRSHGENSKLARRIGTTRWPRPGLSFLEKPGTQGQKKKDIFGEKRTEKLSANWEGRRGPGDMVEARYRRQKSERKFGVGLNFEAISLGIRI